MSYAPETDTLRQAGRDALQHGPKTPASVRVTVVVIRVVRMRMAHRLMAVPVRVRLGYRTLMAMLVMFVVDVGMLMLERLMRVFMHMPLGQVEVEAHSHQSPRNNDLQGKRIAKNAQRQDRTDKGGQREIGAGAGSAEVAQAEHEHDQADADPEETDNRATSGDANRRQGRTQDQRQRQIGRASRKALDHGDLHRVGR